ncbi:hypothetical protein NB311A_07738 [Nitrobacter sp. Nb-311A]|uniref:hypothetical protein n=1 Tax=unclassified Nitrobacter TaxID=2620411 RepID=UPI0000684C1A|nr:MULTISPECIES: hypothetical protein [unclassified Nitrobacter]EAQ37024.1 hypothetical protein NB311A_07738 [Nitrobacter sp. Nb-311A]MCB1393382.1 hypothetical protein [Nitrobacter sp.]MCV0387061.1 hypothetical protein [Nitrobacter sp.]
MQADVKKQMLSLLNFRLLALLLPALALSILAGMVMYALGYFSMVYGEVVLVLKILMHLLLAVWSAVKAILLGIVVFGLLLVFLSPVLIVLWELRKKQNPPSDASSLTSHPSSSTAAETRL